MEFVPPKSNSHPQDHVVSFTSKLNNLSKQTSETSYDDDLSWKWEFPENVIPFTETRIEEATKARKSLVEAIKAENKPEIFKILNQFMPEISDRIFIRKKTALHVSVENGKLEISKAGIDRGAYMDDLNDQVTGCKTDEEAVNLAISNDIRLNKQSIRVGFKKNEGKTTFIPLNIDKQKLLNKGIDEKCILTDTNILGFEFTIVNSQFNVHKAADSIINSLSQHIKMIHASRSYFNDHEKRLKIARTVCYSYMGYLPLIYVYGEHPRLTTDQTEIDQKNVSFKRVRTRVNDLIRATGLRNTTPQEVLDKCLGTNLVQFARQGVICDGLKLIEIMKINPFVRLNKINSTGFFAVPGSFFRKFRLIWNNLTQEIRDKLLSLKHKQRKELLKNERKLIYNSQIYDDYKWQDYFEM